MKRNPTLSINDAINQFFEENPDFHEKVIESKALNIAKQHFEKLKKYIKDIKIQDGILYLYINSDNMRHYILMEKEQIINEINTKLSVYLIRDIVSR